jgi:ADP-ribose pyrophosphatase
MAEEPGREEALAAKWPFKGRLIRVRVERVRLPNGGQTVREVVEHPGAVAILPLLDKERVVMVRQYRRPVNQVLLEVPAGTLRAGERPEECAHRELVEETGYRAAKLRWLCSFHPSPGYSTETMHIYLAEELVQVGQKTEPDESITVSVLPLKAAIMMAQRGELKDAKTIIALLLAQHLLS